MQAPEPFFAEIRGERLFCVLHRPAHATTCAALLVPPFAEEANKTRHLVTRQARKLAATGVAVFLVDLYGTGDSAGEFADATWQRWCDDVTGAADWLRAAGYEVIVPVCVRLGAALALSAGLLAKPNPVVLWQPVFSGRSYFNQFIRLRLAGGLTDGNRLSRADLEAELARGGYLDVAGYRLNSALIEALQSIEPPADPPQGPIAWFEVASAVQPALSRAARQTVASWRDCGAELTATAVTGDPFWATQELGFAPDLVDATTRWITTRV